MNGKQRRSEKIHARDSQQRTRTNAVRQTDPTKTERAADGRIDQSPRYGIDRIIEQRAGAIYRHANLHLPRPRIHLLVGYAYFGNDTGRN